MIHTSDIVEASAALACHDLVVGPALDGGYWLLGMSRFIPELFDGIPWSTDRVLRETLSRAASLTLKVHQLRPLGDVDTAADWFRYQRERGLAEEALPITEKFTLHPSAPVPDPPVT
jgi:glycosyltransferase A (GT-A) superfamily protein (DUF2064 family)